MSDTTVPPSDNKGEERNVPPNDNKVEESETLCAFFYMGERYHRDQISNNEVVHTFVRVIQNFLARKEANVGASIEEQTESVSKLVKDVQSTVVSDVGEDFETFEVDCSVKDSEIKELLKRAATRHYDACFEITEDQNIYLKCAALLKKDFVCKDFYNLGGTVSWNYPKNILIPIAFKSKSLDESNENAILEGSEMTNFVQSFSEYLGFSEKASVARCRSRFPVPVILYKNRFICRSGTLAVRKGAAFEAATKAMKPEGQAVGQWGEPLFTYLFSCATDILKNVTDALSLIVYGVEEMKDIDAKILKVLEIKYICDLMVENRKLHTGMWVSSSEKINMAKYGEFRCLRIPYPGCEFFKEYSKIKSSPDYETMKKSLLFNWESPEADSNLGFAEEEVLPFAELDWNSYMTWDLVTLTKNYMRLLLHFLENGEGGLLVHCISGWDRTPLFISLLRVSLWADNLIHQELDVNQMAYFTIGYDWYLFGHNLPTRLKRQEEIMHFFFKFLPEIASAEFSLIKDSEEKPKLLQNRSDLMRKLSEIFVQNYEECTKVKIPDIDETIAEYYIVDPSDCPEPSSSN